MNISTFFKDCYIHVDCTEDYFEMPDKFENLVLNIYTENPGEFKLRFQQS